MTAISGTYNFRNTNGDLYDPSNVTIIIKDPNGTTQATLYLANLTRVSTGVYQLNWTLPSNPMKGGWLFSASTTDFSETIAHHYVVRGQGIYFA